MEIGTGTKLGPYEVICALGAGGMGEVYRARDTRLDRTVAVKVLFTHLKSEPDLKQRFEREARAISSLNHPHICHPVTRLQSYHTTNRWPLFLPDGRHFLYLASNHQDWAGSEHNGIYVGSVDGGESRFLLPADSSVAVTRPCSSFIFLSVESAPRLFEAECDGGIHFCRFSGRQITSDDRNGDEDQGNARQCQGITRR